MKEEDIKYRKMIINSIHSLRPHDSGNSTASGISSANRCAVFSQSSFCRSNRSIRPKLGIPSPTASDEPARVLSEFTADIGSYCGTFCG